MMRIPTIFLTTTSLLLLSLPHPSSSFPTTPPATTNRLPSLLLLLPPLHPLTTPFKNLTDLPTTRALLPLPHGKTLDITAYPTVPLPSPAYRWALFSILQDLRSSSPSPPSPDPDPDPHHHHHNPTDIVSDLYIFDEWGTVLRARTYQRYMVALTYEGLAEAVEVLAGWLGEGHAWVCNGIVREVGGGKGGRPVGYLSFELV